MLLLGLGEIAQYHLRAMKATGTTLTAVADNIKEKRDRFVASEYYVKGMPVEETVENLLPISANEMIVATPPDQHAKVVQPCIDKYGCITPLVEKPIVPPGEDIPDGLADKAFVIYHWQYGPEAICMRKIAKEQTNQNIQVIRVEIRDPYLDKNGHIRPEKESKGGAWTDSGVNALSFVGTLVDLSKKSSVNLQHIRKDGDTPVESLCTFMCDGTYVYIHIKWTDKDEKKYSTIIMDGVTYMVNHSEMSVTNDTEQLLAPCGGNRLEKHYAQFYASRDWKDDDKRKKNSALTKAIHHILNTQVSERTSLINRISEYLILKKIAKQHKKSIDKAESYRNSSTVPESTVAWLSFLALLLFTVLFLLSWKFACVKYIMNWGQSHINGLIANIVINFIASLVSIVLAYFLYQYYARRRNKHEDDIKVEYHDEIQSKQYGNNYFQENFIHGKPFSLYYAPIYDALLDKGRKVYLSYSSYKFELDPFIRTQYMSLLGAHAQDSFKNTPTVRLRKVEKPQEAKENITLFAQQTNYLSHMLTNRAVDFHMDGGASLRSLFEYEDVLTPLEKSKFANHIGLNALIIIGNKDNGGQYVILPQRGKKATISKNMITASVATRLKLPDYRSAHKIELTYPESFDKIADEQERKDTTYWWNQWHKRIASAMEIDEKELPAIEEIKITLIGAGRDIYEGGKPTIFYLIEIPNMSAEAYYKLKWVHTCDIDEVEHIHIIPMDELLVLGNTIIRKHGNMVRSRKWYSKRIHWRPYTIIRPEKNLLALLWHYCHYQSYGKPE